MLPGFALNQERTGENDIAGAPANSVAEPPGRVVRSAQIQSRGQILSERERERGWESHSVTEKTAVALFDRKAGSGELRFQLEECDRFFQRLLARQAIVGFVKQKPATFWKVGERFSARRIYASTE